MEKNVTIWPSIWVAFPWLLVALAFTTILTRWLGAWGWIIPLAFYLYKGLELVFCHSYTFNDNTGIITERKGVFSVHKVEVHYFRIKSVQVKKPFFMRLVGIANVEVITSEPFKPFLRFYGIRQADEWAKFLQNAAEWWRNENGVKETDFHHF